MVPRSVIDGRSGTRRALGTGLLTRAALALACCFGFLLSPLAAAQPDRAISVAPKAPGSVPPPLAAANPSSPVTDRIWTVMVYMDGDNNLEPFALLDMEEMRQSGDPSRVNLLVLIDRADGYSTDDGDWKGTRLYRLVGEGAGRAKWQVVEDLGEQNMGDPAVLQRFVSRSLAGHPAPRHALIMWDHGGGWSNHANDMSAPGAPGGTDYLTLVELRSALEGIASAAPLDLIGFDMCLMAQLETMMEMQSVARVMVASEAVEPGDGWPYREVLNLFSNEQDAKTIASGIVDAFGGYYARHREPVYTLSAIDLSGVSRLARATDEMMGMMDMSAAWPDIVRSIYFSESYIDLADDQRGPHALQSIDLFDLLDNLASMKPRLKKGKEWKEFTAAYEGAVIDAKSSPRHRLSHGVAVYAPYRGELMSSEYGATRMAQESRWGRSLTRMHQQESAAPGQARIKEIETWSGLRDEPVADVIQLGQDGLLYHMECRNSLQVNAWRGTIGSGGKLSLYYKEIFAFHDSNYLERDKERDRVTAVKGYQVPDGPIALFDRIDGTHLVVTDGSKRVNATIDQSDIAAHEQGFYLARVIYDDPHGGRYPGTLRFNWMWQADNLVLAVTQTDGSVAYMSVAPRPDARLHFITETYDAAGTMGEEVAGSLVWGRGLGLTIDLLPPGQYATILGVEDLGGKTTYKRHDYMLSENHLPLLQALHVENVTIENLQGEWTVMDAAPWFSEGRLVPIGTITFTPRPGFDRVLDKAIFKGKERIGAENLVTLLPTSGLPLVTDLVLNDDDEPDQGWSVRAGLVALERNQGRSLLISMDLSDGAVGVWQKTRGPEPRVIANIHIAFDNFVREEDAHITGDSESAPGAAGAGPGQSSSGGSLDGVWQAADGSVLAFQGGQWALQSFGQIRDGGMYQFDGSTLRTQSQLNGAVTDYRVQTDGRTLLLQDAYGTVYQFSRTQ